ncbi:MAG TPA: PD-(D/E)XK nuclease family protein, partial [Streptosporangiaceae bacterium]|nr:PD-(D/E)XK nuclease family protein [Streptosporangiaceae bacterium]
MDEIVVVLARGDEPESPPELPGPPGDGGILPPVRPWALSPSRAADFMTCPLLYRFRVIDRLPEPPTTATARGTL